MSNNIKISLAATVAILLFVAFNTFYTVNQADQAIVLQFGEPKRVIKTPGLKMKVPFIQNVVFYDVRLLKP